MKKIKSMVSAGLAAALLVACGGGGGDSASKISFFSMVNFGDSLSDVGTYAVGAVAAPVALGGGAGGRFTVNSGTATPAKIWVDFVATDLSLPAPCAAVKGLDGNAAFGFSVPAAPQAACTNYAQGGARVTNPVGPGNKLLGGGNAVLGQLTYPLARQVADHLSRNASAFNPKSLVTVFAGGNDVFMQGAVAGAAAGINPADPTTIAAFTNTAANLGGWSAAQIGAVLSGGGQNAVVGGLLANMGKAGTEQAELIKTQIIAKGAKYVLVVNLPNVGATPNGFDAGTQTAALSTAMSQAFNKGLLDGLVGVSEVAYADAFATSTDQFNNPSKYGLSNVTSRACKAGPTSGNILGGAALTCNPSNVIAGNISTYGFSDDVHPSPFGHQLLGNFILEVLAAKGWR